MDMISMGLYSDYDHVLPPILEGATFTHAHGHHEEGGIEERLAEATGEPRL